MATTRTEDTVTGTFDPGSGRQDDAADAVGRRRVADTARDLADTMSDAATRLSPRLSDAAASTAEAVRESDRMIRSTSDQGLVMIGALSIGTAIGLLVGGSNRFLVILSLVPAVMVGRTIVERLDQAGRRSAGSHD
jgi:hypothetical protein